MVLNITLADEYSYVLATLVASAFVNLYHGLKTGGARKVAGVPYPNPYASAAEAATDPKKYRFNCAQRAHTNFLESWPSWAITTVVAGLQYPVATAALGAVWLVGRVVYMNGYVNDAPDGKGAGRVKGSFYAIGQVGVMGLAAWTVGGKMIGGY